MKTLAKFSMMLGMVFVVAVLLMSSNVAAVVLAPADSDTIVRPGLGIGNAPIVVVRPAPRPFFFNPFLNPFNRFFFNPFVDVDIDPFFGFGAPFIDDEPFGLGVRPGFAD